MGTVGWIVLVFGLLVVVLCWYSCCYFCVVCVYLYPYCLYHDGCMAVPVTGTALDLALLLLFVDLLLGLFLICRMGFCGLGWKELIGLGEINGLIRNNELLVNGLGSFLSIRFNFTYWADKST
jgi:hypothetical protein